LGPETSFSGTCIQHHGEEYNRTEPILLGVRTNSDPWDRVGGGNFPGIGSPKWRLNGRDIPRLISIENLEETRITALE
jgi:hypothetical protein